MDCLRLTQALAESFNALADEVQSLTDRKTILEHKLRFAHEQFQYLADKHAPAAPEISETLARLQIPPELHHQALKDSGSVPLPRRSPTNTHHQIALLIRDGRRVAQQLATMSDPSKESLSSQEPSLSRTASAVTSMSTVLEQDFTVEGKKGQLSCPFSAPQQVGDENQDSQDEKTTPGLVDPTPHLSADPICAAMFEERMDHPAPRSATGSAAKCPIRFLDKHSPEEIAHYVETHKHDLPRSHEVCLSRYQRSEEQIRKLDAKYGNLVSMIQGLSQIHKSMLPEEEPDQLERRSELDRASNERVENWAQAVSATTADAGTDDQTDGPQEDAVLDRESHFDRPLKEVRVGESPSRPWGISVPLYEPVGRSENGRPISPPPAPVRMPSPTRSNQSPTKTPRKCPFDHTRLAGMREMANPHQARPEHEPELGPRTHLPHVAPPRDLPAVSRPQEPQPALASVPQQTAFINPEIAKGGGYNGPQMVFTGPVFIGYPIEQAIQFMQQFQGNQRASP